MLSHPDDVVRGLIASLRKDFLSLLRGEATSFDGFLDACSKFDKYIHAHQDSFSNDALELIDDFSSTVSLFSSQMVELDNHKKAALAEFPRDIDALLSSESAKLNISDVHQAPSQPTYLEPCARWLKANWYNPYPSAQTRSNIAYETQALRKDIDAWFIDARKRIGWNALRRKHFSNKRADILQAAAAFAKNELVSSDPELLSPQIENEFAAILARAASMYDQRFCKSRLADKLDSAVRDLTPSLKGLQDEKVQPNLETNRRARLAYPSPERSPATATELLASPSPPAGDLTLASNSPSLGRKRRCSLQSEDQDLLPPQCKRPRSQSVGREPNPERWLPSPAASTQEELSESSAASSPRSSALCQLKPTDPSRPTGKRKRRLSDGFQYPVAKRPQIRPQVVSDPFPAASGEDWDQWFHEHVLSSPELTLTGEIPPPVTVEAPDSNAPLDIQLFNFPLVPDIPPSVPALPAPAAELNVVEPLEVPATTQVSVDSATVSLDPTFSWVSNDFIPPLQPTNTCQSSADLYVSFPTLDVMSQPFPNTQSSAFLPDPSLWSNISVPDLDFSALFNQLPPTSALAVPIVPFQTTISTSKTLSEQERKAKRKELEELEARAQAIRAEISAP